MKISLKTLSGTVYTLEELEPSLTVKELRAVAGKHTDIGPECLRMIFKGKVLKDELTLTEASLVDGDCIIIVKSRKKKRKKNLAREHKEQKEASVTHERKEACATEEHKEASVTQASTGTAAPRQTPVSQPVAPAANTSSSQAANSSANQPYNPLGLLAFPQAPASASGNGRADFMRNMLRSQTFQNLMSNPDFITGIVESNPQLRRIFESNPQMRHMLRSPDTMRQIMQVMENPALYEEMLRNQDRRIMNIESMPGGRQALEDMYNNIQAPMEEALSGNRRASEDDTVVPDLDTESGPRGDSIPNPWAQNQNSSNAQSRAAPFGNSMDMSSILSGMLGQGRGQASSTAQSNPLGTPLLGQLGNNPNAMFQMMQNPAVQSMMQSMMQNPQYMSNIMSSLGTNSNLRTMMNPAAAPQAAPSPPQANTSSAQAPRAQVDAPPAQADVPNAPSGAPVAQADSSMADSNQVSNSNAASNIPAHNAAPVPVQPVANVPQPVNANPLVNPANPFAALFAPMMQPPAQQPNNLNQVRNPLLAFLNAQNVNAAQQAARQPLVLTEAQAREMYASQLAQLRSMGFHDEARNLRALRETAGSVEASLDRLFR